MQKTNFQLLYYKSGKIMQEAYFLTAKHLKLSIPSQLKNFKFTFPRVSVEEAILLNQFENENIEKNGFFYLTFELEHDRLTMDVLPLGSKSVEIKPKELDFETEEMLALYDALNTKQEVPIQSAFTIPDKPLDLEIDKELWELFIIAINLGENTMILGPKGTGKTSLSQFLATSLNYDFHRFNFGAAAKAKSFFCGTMQAQEGSTYLVKSEFLKAFSNDIPTLIMADEITRTPSQAANYAMTIFEMDKSYIYSEDTGEKIYKGEQVRFIGAGNLGQQYTDTRVQDGALWDRFVKLTIDYLPADKEFNLLKRRRPNCPENLIKQLIIDANKLRIAEKEGHISSGLSTRQLLSAANFLSQGVSYKTIWDKMLINNFINGNLNETENIKQIIQS